MFDINTYDVRKFFANVWKNRFNKNLDLMEKRALNIILAYPQYHYYLENIEKYLNYDFTPEKSQTNPFLHLSLHLSIQEQVSIDQPLGIREIHLKLCNKYNNNWVEAENKMMDYLVEMIWEAQKNNTPFNENLYIESLKLLI